MPNVALAHLDAPYPASSWASARVTPGWSPESADALRAIRPGAPEESDMVYTMSYPFNQLNHTPGVLMARFVVSEFGLLHSGFRGGQPAVDAMGEEAAVIVTPSEWSRAKLVSGGLPQEKIRVVPHGVATDVFRPLSTEARGLLRSRLAIPQDAFCFLNVGAMTWNKGIDLLLRAFAQVRLIYPQCLLILKDQAPLYGISAQTLIQQTLQRHQVPDAQGLVGAIRLLSSQLSAVQLAETYNCVDCYVSPYRAEGFNMPVLEALACGVAPLVTAGGPTDDFLGPFGSRLAAQAMPVTHLPEALRQDLIDHSSYFLEPSFDALVTGMAHAVAQQSSEAQALREARSRHAHQYAWQAVTQTLIDVLRGSGQGVRVSSASA